jgi:hypothetical protein
LSALAGAKARQGDGQQDTGQARGARGRIDAGFAHLMVGKRVVVLSDESEAVSV